MKKFSFLLALSVFLVSCTNLTPEQQNFYDTCLKDNPLNVDKQYKDLGLTGATSIEYKCEEIAQQK